MQTDSLIIYFLVITVSVGLIVALFFRFRYAVADLEAKVTGIWSNEDNTMRILIYGVESQFQAEVVWTKNIDEKILGSGIIRNLNLKYFSWGEGTYIDPITKHQYHFKMKVKKPGRLFLQLFDEASHSLHKVEEWKLVH